MKHQKTVKIKTSGGYIMKTNFKSLKGNNVQRTILKSVVAGVCIFIISASVKGQDFLSEDGTFNNIVMAIFSSTENGSTEASVSNFSSTYFVEEKEEIMKLEEWMKNENYFGTFNTIETESEEPLELESWMIEETIFTTGSAIYEKESDATLELETWMINKDYFENQLFELETDKTLVVEDWMLNENNFQVNEEIEQPMELENWMIASNFWKK